MSWDWSRRGQRWRDPDIVTQIHEYGCGAACVAMLLADRRRPMDLIRVQSGLHLPSTAAELARRLRDLSGAGFNWVGGQLDLDPPIGPREINQVGSNGSWAAQLIPASRKDGHWVVVDALMPDLWLAVRDPIGCRYELPLLEFGTLARHMVFVFDAGGSR